MPFAGTAGAQGDAEARAGRAAPGARDPGTVKDFRAFCEAAGHELVADEAEAGEFRFLIRKTG
jgi:Sulfurtransferase TusA